MTWVALVLAILALYLSVVALGRSRLIMRRNLEMMDRIDIEQRKLRGILQNPWSDFLHFRARCIDWLHEQGHSDEQIAQQLSMDGPVQVRLIRTRPLDN